MSLEKPATTRRQEWDAERDETQANVDALLADIALDIEAAELYIKHCMDSGNLDDAQSLVKDTVAKLDEKWGSHMGEVFHVWGRWHVPEFSIDGGNIISTNKEVEAFESASSTGFAVKTLKDDSGDYKTLVGLQFRQHTIAASFPDYSAIIQPLAFAKLHDISLQYLRPGTIDVVSGDVVDISQRLDQADALIKMHLNSEKSNFYTASAKKQRRLFQNVEDSFYEALPDAGALDRAMLTDAEGTVIFVRNYDNEKLKYLQTSGQDKMVISGKIRGIAFAESIDVASDHAFRSPDEFKTENAGLSLVVEPIEMNFQLDDYKGDILVPLSFFSSYSLSTE